MEFSICWLTPPPQDQDQKYLENSHYLAQRMVVEGGVHKGKNKRV